MMGAYMPFRRGGCTSIIYGGESNGVGIHLTEDTRGW